MSDECRKQKATHQRGSGSHLLVEEDRSLNSVPFHLLDWGGTQTRSFSAFGKRTKEEHGREQGWESWNPAGFAVLYSIEVSRLKTFWHQETNRHLQWYGKVTVMNIFTFCDGRSRIAAWNCIDKDCYLSWKIDDNNEICNIALNFSIFWEKWNIL